MTPLEIRAQIEKFPYWHYRFDLDGALTPASESRITRHIERKAYFFDPLVKLLGGSLKGKRVLDLGCNAGFWSLHALEAGADFVLGIDAHPANLLQAEFVFEVKGVAHERYLFKQANVFDTDFLQFGDFDLVLCLGLLYHVNRPIALLEKIGQVNRDILLLDTSLSQFPGPVLELRNEPRRDSQPSLSSPDSNLVVFPSRQAVLDIVHRLGYGAVILRPKFSNYLGASDYKAGRRRAFVCARRTNLAILPAATESIDPVADLARLNLGYARKALGRLNNWARAHLGAR